MRVGQWKQCPWIHNQSINVPIESACPIIQQSAYAPSPIPHPPTHGPAPNPYVNTSLAQIRSTPSIFKPVYNLAPASSKVVVPYQIIDPLEPFVPTIPEIVEGPVKNVCDFGSSFYCLASQYKNGGNPTSLSRYTIAAQHSAHKAHYAPPRAFSNELNDQNGSYDPAFLAGPIDANKFAQYASASGAQADLALGLNPNSEIQPFPFQPGQTF
jgi:hypothetical protein